MFFLTVLFCVFEVGLVVPFQPLRVSPFPVSFQRGAGRAKAIKAL